MGEGCPIELAQPELCPRGSGSRGSGSRNTRPWEQAPRESALGEPTLCEPTPGPTTGPTPPFRPACATGSSTAPSQRWEPRSREQAPLRTRPRENGLPLEPILGERIPEHSPLWSRRFGTGSLTVAPSGTAPSGMGSPGISVSSRALSGLPSYGVALSGSGPAGTAHKLAPEPAPQAGPPSWPRVGPPDPSPRSVPRSVPSTQPYEPAPRPGPTSGPTSRLHDSAPSTRPPGTGLAGAAGGGAVGEVGG
jgi:hypothetical protein